LDLSLLRMTTVLDLGRSPSWTPCPHIFDRSSNHTLSLLRKVTPLSAFVFALPAAGSEALFRAFLLDKVVGITETRLRFFATAGFG
jgi:hypothetical protein